MSRSRRPAMTKTEQRLARRRARRRRSRWKTAGVAIGIVVLLGAGGWWIQRLTQDVLVVPEFSAHARAGARLFAANCAACHGTHAAGTDRGPPLVHAVYEPGHHPNAAFQRAVSQGVMSHHWNFGNMPPVPGVSQSEVTRIVAYVRELQRANDVY